MRMFKERQSRREAAYYLDRARIEFVNGNLWGAKLDFQSVERLSEEFEGTLPGRTTFGKILYNALAVDDFLTALEYYRKAEKSGEDADYLRSINSLDSAEKNIEKYEAWYEKHKHINNTEELLPLINEIRCKIQNRK